MYLFAQEDNKRPMNDGLDWFPIEREKFRIPLDFILRKSLIEIVLIHIKER